MTVHRLNVTDDNYFVLVPGQEEYWFNGGAIYNMTQTSNTINCDDTMLFYRGDELVAAVVLDAAWPVQIAGEYLTELHAYATVMNGLKNCRRLGCIEWANLEDMANYIAWNDTNGKGGR